MSNALNDTFITLVSVAEENENIRQILLRILALEGVARRMAVIELAENMQQQQAPRDFIDALLYLTDDKISQALKHQLQK